MKKRTQRADHEERLKHDAGERERVKVVLADYLSRTGFSSAAFASRINYSEVTLRMFLSDKYHHVAGTGLQICRAITKFIAEHPIEPPRQISGELYDTANVREIRGTFQQLLPRPVAYMIYAPPGSQKSFALEHEVARLNREELCRNGHGRRAYYVYARHGIKPRDLMKRVAIACGSHGSNDIDPMLRGLSWDFRGRRVLLIVDEAQHLSIDCFEVLRELLDQPPHFSLLFAGSHDLKNTFDRFSATLEQWNSRIIRKVKLPGLLPEEAEGIVRREIGDVLTRTSAEKAAHLVKDLVAKATTKDVFEKGCTYINVRTLTNSLDRIKADAAARIA